MRSNPAWLFAGCFLALATLHSCSTSLANSGPLQRATSTPSPQAGRHGYRRFHANDSYVGQLAPCTPEEKLCFRFNALYDHEAGKCDYSRHADLGQFFKTGHFRAVETRYKDPCPGYRMAYDGRCYREEMVRHICGCNEEPTPHILGGVECRCSPATPIDVEQPNEDGQCRIPDFRFRNMHNSLLFKSPFDDIQGFTNKIRFAHIFDPAPLFSCSTKQHKCFQDRKVWVPQAKGCFKILDRGACPTDHVVAMDIKAAREGRVEIVCAHSRGGCSTGQRRMAFDGQCYSDAHLQIIVPGRVTLNQFGIYVTVAPGSTLNATPFVKEQANNTCFVIIKEYGSLAGTVPAIPPCPTTNEGKCNYELLLETSLPADE